MTAAVWYIFILIIGQTYTANLASFLTIDSKWSPISSVEDLANQNEIKYGAKLGGSTMNFFKDSEDPLYQRMWQTMSRDPSVFTRNNEDGQKRVQKSDYAFFMESTSIEYLTERHCDITQVGNLLDAKSYGIAMQKNSPYRNALSAGVLKLAETGRLQDLKRRWWKQRKGGGACEATSSSGSAEELGLDNVGGVFLVLVVGLAIAIIVAIFELVIYNYHKCRKEKISFKEELVEDLKFISRCRGSTKPVRKADGSEETTIPEEAEAQYSSASVIRRDSSLEQPHFQGPRYSGNRRRSWRGSRRSSVVSRKRSASTDQN